MEKMIDNLQTEMEQLKKGTAESAINANLSDSSQLKDDSIIVEIQAENEQQKTLL